MVQGRKKLSVQGSLCLCFMLPEVALKVESTDSRADGGHSWQAEAFCLNNVSFHFE